MYWRVRRGDEIHINQAWIPGSFDYKVSHAVRNYSVVRLLN